MLGDEPVTHAELPSQLQQRTVIGRPIIARWCRGSSVIEAQEGLGSAGGAVRTVDADETWIHAIESGTKTTLCHIGPSAAGAGNSPAAADGTWITITGAGNAFDAKGHFVSNSGTISHIGPSTASQGTALACADGSWIQLSNVSSAYDAKGHFVCNHGVICHIGPCSATQGVASGTGDGTWISVTGAGNAFDAKGHFTGNSGTIGHIGPCTDIPPGTRATIDLCETGRYIHLSYDTKGHTFCFVKDASK